MIPIGTRVAVMPTNNVPAQLIGCTGIVSGIHVNADDVKIDVLLDVIPPSYHQFYKNTSNGSRYYKFSERDLSVIKTEPKITLNLSPAQIKKVIFNNPKTIIIWADGTKTIVSCSEGDTYDEYAGFCAAIAKKICGCTANVKKIINNHK